MPMVDSEYEPAVQLADAAIARAGAVAMVERPPLTNATATRALGHLMGEA